MAWWVVVLLYVMVLAAIAALGVFVLRYAADDGRLVHRHGVRPPKPKPLIRPLSKRALTSLRARVASQHKTALARSGASVWGRTVTGARKRPRLPGRPRRTALPPQAAPADVPETVAAED